MVAPTWRGGGDIVKGIVKKLTRRYAAPAARCFRCAAAIRFRAAGLRVRLAGASADTSEAVSLAESLCRSDGGSLPSCRRSPLRPCLYPINAASRMLLSIRMLGGIRGLYPRLTGSDISSLKCFGRFRVRSGPDCGARHHIRAASAPLSSFATLPCSALILPDLLIHLTVLYFSPLVSKTVCYSWVTASRSRKVACRSEAVNSGAAESNRPAGRGAQKRTSTRKIRSAGHDVQGVRVVID